MIYTIHDDIALPVCLSNMNTLLGMTSTLVDVYNEKIEDLGLSPFFRVDKGWKDEEEKVVDRNWFIYTLCIGIHCIHYS